MASAIGLPVDVLGGHDGGPPTTDYYKRAVYRASPRRFEVDILPPTKFGKSYCYGLRIYPILSDSLSSISGSTNSEYEIWRRWDDCLWFQDILEHRYSVISREKRLRLEAGKGVKKNGMYIHDRASSFESLPPGPDPKSVAKDIHEYLPKLAKRGTFFRATQATIDQRQKEFVALIKAFFQDDVPSLIQELREDRIIRDFFGYWRRDRDLAVKENRARQKTAPNDAISTRSFRSSNFSISSSSLSLTTPPHATLPHAPSPPLPPLPQTPRSNSSSRRPGTTDSPVCVPDASPAFPGSTRIPPSPSLPSTRSSAPARLRTTSRDGTVSEDEHNIHERKISTSSSPSSALHGPPSPALASSSGTRSRANSHGTKPSPSPRSETFNVESDFPLFLSSSTRDLLPSSRPPHSPTYATPGLGTLPEDAELSSPVPTISPPTVRSRKDFPAHTGRANRNCVLWHDTDEVSSSEGDVLERELLTPVDSTSLNVAVARSTSSSSLPSSISLSNLSLHSRRSSWRTSSEHATPCSAGPKDLPIEIDFPRVPSTDSLFKLEHSASPKAMADSSSTSRRSLSGSRRRSLSQPLPFSPLVPTDVDKGDWSDQEDFLEAYFGGPEPFFDPNDESLALHHGVPSDWPHDVPYDAPDSPFMTGFPTPRQRVSYISGPPSAFHRPWTRSSSSLPPSPDLSSEGIPMSTSVAGGETLLVKAALDDAIVLFRAQRDVSFTELRQRVYDKFARSEHMSLRRAFVLAYVPPYSGVGDKRVSTISSTSMGSVDWARAVPLRDEEDWATALMICGLKITLRVSNLTTTP